MNTETETHDLYIYHIITNPLLFLSTAKAVHQPDFRGRRGKNLLAASSGRRTPNQHERMVATVAATGSDYEHDASMHNVDCRDVEACEGAQPSREQGGSAARRHSVARELGFAGTAVIFRDGRQHAVAWLAGLAGICAALAYT